MLKLELMQISSGMLKALLHYDPDSGIFIWLVDRGKGSKARIGMEAGRTRNYKGRPYITIYLYGRHHFAHRLAYLYMTDTWPPTSLDHKDNDGTNNKWTNIRLADLSQNGANAKRYSTNTSGRKGVTWHKQIGRWQAQIKKDGRTFYLGLFDCLDAAHGAYLAKAKELFGEFARAE